MCGGRLRTGTCKTTNKPQYLGLLAVVCNNYEIIVVTASLGVTRRRSLCRHVLLTAVCLNTT